MLQNKTINNIQCLSVLNVAPSGTQRVPVTLGLHDLKPTIIIISESVCCETGSLSCRISCSWDSF